MPGGPLEARDSAVFSQAAIATRAPVDDKALAAPVAVVDERVGEDEVGLEVEVFAVVGTFSVGDVAVDTPDGAPHLR